jgi:hypothetical protein
MFLEVLSSWSMEDCSIPKPMVPTHGEASSTETACFWKGFLTGRCRITVYQSRWYHLKCRPHPPRCPVLGSAISLVDGDLRFTKANGTISWRGLTYRDTMSLGVCSQRYHDVVPMLK